MNELSSVIADRNEQMETAFIKCEATVDVEGTTKQGFRPA